MRIPIPAVLAALVAGLLLGAGMGFVRSSDKPASEARLAQRALAYYRAAKEFDFRTMASMYTPARQLDEAEALRELASKRAREFASFKNETRADLHFSAESITAERISAVVNGDWAETNGTCLVRAGDDEAEMSLEPAVWVRSGADWWIYELKYPEIAAYGLPPEPFRLTLEKPKSQSQKTLFTKPEQTPVKKPTDQAGEVDSADGGASEIESSSGNQGSSTEGGK